MRFYDRESEIQQLLQLDRMVDVSAQFTVLIGRRRTGKTTLMTEAFRGKRYLYFFVGKKTEQIQCAEFQQQVEDVVKRNIQRYNPKVLEKKYQNIQGHLRGYKVSLIGLSLDDM